MTCLHGGAVGRHFVESAATKLNKLAEGSAIVLNDLGIFSVSLQRDKVQTFSSLSADIRRLINDVEQMVINLIGQHL